MKPPSAFDESGNKRTIEERILADLAPYLNLYLLVPFDGRNPGDLIEVPISNPAERAQFAGMMARGMISPTPPPSTIIEEPDSLLDTVNIHSNGNRSETVSN